MTGFIIGLLIGLLIGFGACEVTGRWLHGYSVVLDAWDAIKRKFN